MKQKNKNKNRDGIKNLKKVEGNQKSSFSNSSFFFPYFCARTKRHQLLTDHEN